MVYPTKKDLWLVLIIFLAGFALAGATINNAIKCGIYHPKTWTILIAAVFYGAIIWIFAYPVYYEITTSSLLIRSGLLMKFQIPLSSIKKIRPTKNPLSAPAWSLDRLRIDYIKNGKTTFVLISPEEKTVFYNEIVQMDNGLEIRGNNVVRRIMQDNE